MTDTHSTAAIILAAGSSSRMGRPKQLLRFRGVSLLRRAALAALTAGCRPVIVVTGAHAELSRQQLSGLDVHEIVNHDWPSGMASSIRAGIEALASADPHASATVVMLCDQPHVDADVIARLIAAHHERAAPLVASAYGGGFGVPALFSRALFPELAQLQGVAGAKQVIASHASHAHFVDFANGEVDVDTPEDFDRLTSA